MIAKASAGPQRGFPPQRRGAALAVALFALVTMGAIAHAVLQPAVASRQASRRIASHHRAASAAERAIADVLTHQPRRFWRELSPGALSRMPIRDSSASGAPDPGAARGTVRVIRLDSTLYAIDAEAMVPARDAPVTVRRGVFVEWRVDSAVIPAAIVAGGDVDLAADTRLGRAEDCASGTDSTAGVMVGPEATVRRAGTSTEDGVQRDPAATTAGTHHRPGGIALETILAEPSIRLPEGSAVTPAPIVEGDRCVEGPANWGALTGDALTAPCSGRAPSIVADGDLRIEGGEGRGTLVVKGRLTIAGSFRFAGLVVAMGGLETSGAAMDVTGAVYVPPGASVTIRGGGSVILASRCALQATAEAAARLHVVPMRGWWR